MKKFTLLIFILIVNLSHGQTEKAKNQIVADNFMEMYNGANYQGIFSMFSEGMKEAVPQGETLSFLTGLKSQAGNITQREFIQYEKETYALYKTTFERAVLVLHISIDTNSKINGLLVKPFIPEVNSENTIDNLTLKDSVITKKQSDILFENAKIFPNNTQIAIAIITNGETKYYGLKKKGDTISTIRNQKSYFEIGSISKVFTATLLANFVLEEKIKLEENINTYLQIPMHNNVEIAFLNLANHTSGLPRLPSNMDLTKVNPENPYANYREKELIKYLTQDLVLSNKGDYEYSNLGFGLLGYTLSKKANVTYEKLLRDMIFSKYDMQHSTTDRNNLKGNLVKGLNREGKEVPNWDFSVLVGFGGIYSTAEDLSKFAMAQFDSRNKDLELTRQTSFTLNDNMDIGLGWHILKSQSEGLWFWHNGGTGGYSSSMVIEENSKNGIIILSNVSAFNPNKDNIDTMCFELMKTLRK